MQQKVYVSLFFAILICGFLFKNYIGLPTFNLIVASILIPMVLAIIKNLGSATKAIGRSGKRIVPRVEYPHQFETMFRRILKQRGDKILIIAIDNLDRCDRSK